MIIFNLHSKNTYEINSTQKLKIFSSVFSDCFTEDKGGAIYCTSSSELTILLSTFQRCFAKAEGGSIYSTIKTSMNCSFVLESKTETYSPSFSFMSNSCSYLNTIVQSEGRSDALKFYYIVPYKKGALLQKRVNFFINYSIDSKIFRVIPLMIQLILIC